MNTVIVVAGGSGTRMKMPLKKQYLHLGGAPILQHTLKAFDTAGSVDRICLVVPGEDISYCQKIIFDDVAFSKEIHITAGGRERQESSYNGLRFFNDHNEDDIIIIHDGVRPLVSHDEIESSIAGAEKYGAAIIAVPAYDTIKKVNRDKMIESTPDRETIWHALTPQAFKYRLLNDAYRYARENKITGTDDASLVEMAGRKVRVIEGQRSNIKITTREDIDIAEVFLRS